MSAVRSASGGKSKIIAHFTYRGDWTMSPRETEVESGGLVKGVAIAVVTQNKDDDGLCRVKVRYPVARQAARELLGAAGDADGRQGPRPGADSRSRRRSAGRLRARGPALSLRARRAVERQGQAAARQRRRQERQADAQVAQEALPAVRRRRARASSSSRTRRAARSCSTTTAFVVQDEKGNIVKVDSNSGAMTIEAKGTAQHQGGDDHDRGDRHARAQGQRDARRCAARW